MPRADEPIRTAEGITVLPALIQIQGPLPVAPVVKTGRRRISVLLDHPVCRYLGIFSWVLVAVAIGATKPIAAGFVAIVVFAGLLIGAINTLRWLFGPR
jgi:hypothetical protein